MLKAKIPQEDQSYPEYSGETWYLPSQVAKKHHLVVRLRATKVLRQHLNGAENIYAYHCSQSGGKPHCSLSCRTVFVTRLRRGWLAPISLHPLVGGTAGFDVIILAHQIFRVSSMTFLQDFAFIFVIIF